MRDFMLSRSLHGFRSIGPGIAVPAGDLAESTIAMRMPTSPPATRWPSSTITKTMALAPSSDVAVYVPPPPPQRFTTKETGSPSGSVLRVATVRIPDVTSTRTASSAGGVPAGSAGTPGADLMQNDDGMLTAGDEARNVEGDLSTSAPGGTVFASEGGVTTSSALSSWWARYGVWALSLGGGAVLALLLFWASRRKRR